MNTSLTPLVHEFVARTRKIPDVPKSGMATEMVPEEPLHGGRETGCAESPAESGRNAAVRVRELGSLSRNRNVISAVLVAPLFWTSTSTCASGAGLIIGPA